MKIRNVFYTGLAMLMLGCSSTPLSTSYYLLNNQPSTITTSIETASEENSKRTIVVLIKDLPEYLERSHLVMQMADHRLHYANFHMWAEPLKQGLENALIADLSSGNSRTNFIAYDREMNQDNLSKLFVSVDFFHASAKSEVMLAGQYWASNFDKDNKYQKQSFSFKLQLDEDGYPHSIEKMRLLVSKLAEKIVAEI